MHNNNTDVMEWIRCYNDDNNDDFIRMETANEGQHEDVPSHAEVLWRARKRFDSSKYKKNTTL